MADLLLEIGCEEIPSGVIDPALKWLLENAAERFSKARLSFGEIKTYGTPRRLVLIVKDVSKRQTDLSMEVTGPKIEVAFDPDGKLTKAGLGFVCSKGLVEKDAYQKETDKGRVIAVHISEKGLFASKILPEILSLLIKDLPHPKTMRWDDSDAVFIRPVRWLLCLLGKEILPVQFGKIRAGNKTCGHRFETKKMVSVKSVENYLEYLQKNEVMLDGVKRKEIIFKEASSFAKSVKGLLRPDDALLETVKNLVEYPWPIMGHFDEKYLKIPREILICEMREHQKYFSVIKENGQLLPAFIVVSGSSSKDPKTLAAGNARVLKARFEDGAFYYHEDKKKPLKDYVPLLSKVLFQKELGTILDKTHRIKNLVRKICQLLSIAKDVEENAVQTAHLCKADLVTGVVGQFPELQGIMGCEYALLAGEKKEVALGIKEHYWPKQAKDESPTSDIGAIVSLADRIDTIVSVMGIGKAPKGSADPFALRRLAIGFVRIVTAFSYRLSLKQIISEAILTVQNRLSVKEDVLQKEVLKFVSLRARGVLLEELESKFSKNPTLIVDATMAVSFDDLTDWWSRALALSQLELKNSETFAKLAATFKRVSHIVYKAQEDSLFDKDAKWNQALLKEPVEVELLREVIKVQKQFNNKPEENLFKYYVRLLELIAELKPFVDNFFDGVMVMVEDKELCRARLGLLSEIQKMAFLIADFTKISAE